MTGSTERNMTESTEPGKIFWIKTTQARLGEEFYPQTTSHFKRGDILLVKQAAKELGIDVHVGDESEDEPERDLGRILLTFVIPTTTNYNELSTQIEQLKKNTTASHP